MYTDILTRIRNAQAARKKALKVRYTTMDLAVLELLKRRGFVGEIEVKGRLPKRVIEVQLNHGTPIRGGRFLSRPSIRRYVGFRDLRRVKGGYGLLVLSTPKGIMAGEEARRSKVGGQLLFEVW